MIIDINPLLKGEKNELEVSYLLKIDEDIDGVVFADSFPVNGRIKNMAGYITLNLDAKVKYTAECARCLTPVNNERTITFEKTIVTEDTELQNEDNDDYNICKDGLVDIDETLTEQIVLEMPLRHLCKDDCKGLCPKCGTDLNKNSCNCETKELDPRFDVLRKLLENNDKK